MSALPIPVQALGPGWGPRTLRTDRQGAVLSVELADPDRGNAVTETLLDELLAVLDTRDPEIRVIVLSGAGADFCLGGDRTEYAGQLAQDPTGGGVRGSGAKARRVCEALAQHPAVTIARVQGKAIGAGLALALACDLRVGAEDATFRLPELALGLPTAWGGLLPRLISEVGAARVRELVLTCRTFGAHEARDLSILQKVVPEADLDAAVRSWAAPVSRRPAAALRVTKHLFNAYAGASRLADITALDAELMASVLAERAYTTARGAADGTHGP
ncbi:enoyl-CoA hydratase/isomerase family protein [Streptomyces sp. NPDC059631]|uniref:enoyl-CoA hydratase/isomerase family protein n=1 Tax=unclassified Streptomyces TaxID=2593676 RepID=UPI00367A6EE3